MDIISPILHLRDYQSPLIFFSVLTFLRYVGYFTIEVIPNLDKPLLQFNGASDKLGLVSSNEIGLSKSYWGSCLCGSRWCFSIRGQIILTRHNEHDGVSNPRGLH